VSLCAANTAKQSMPAIKIGSWVKVIEKNRKKLEYLFSPFSLEKGGY
jgi:hypothetical protein